MLNGVIYAADAAQGRSLKQLAEGYAVIQEICRSREQTLQIIRRRLPDVLIISDSCPQTELVKQVRRQMPSMEIVVILREASFEQVLAYMRLHVFNCLLYTKVQEELPVTLKRLCDKIQWLRESRRETMKQTQEQLQKIGRLRELGLRLMLQWVISSEERDTAMEEADIAEAQVLLENRMTVVMLQWCFDEKQCSARRQQEVMEQLCELVCRELSIQCQDLQLEQRRNKLYVFLTGLKPTQAELKRMMERLEMHFGRIRSVPAQSAVFVYISKEVHTAAELYRQLKIIKRCAYDSLLGQEGSVMMTEEKNDDEEVFDWRCCMEQCMVDGQPEEWNRQTLTEAWEQLKQSFGEDKGLRGIHVREILLCLLEQTVNQYTVADIRQVRGQALADIERKLEYCAGTERAFALLIQSTEQVRQQYLQLLLQKESQPVWYAKEYIRRYGGKNVSLKALSQKVGFSYNYFSNLFKRETGITLTDYVQKTRVATAQRLLLQRDRKVSDVAEVAGYSDLKFFCRQFKKFTGVTPNEYRKKILLELQESHKSTDVHGEKQM